MNVSAPPARRSVPTDALAAIAAGANALDAAPRFPQAAFEQLAAAGLLGLNLPGRGASFAEELDAVRRVAHADSSVGRIFDGQLNAIERLRLADLLDPAACSLIESGRLLLGVWGADPTREEGEPARLSGGDRDVRCNGVKTFCSGAGGVQRALVVVRDGPRNRRLAYVDCAEGVFVDRSWYQAAGLRSSESHRVVFDDARVIALVGGVDELLREPYLSRDALRTAASWAGIADRVVDGAFDFARTTGRTGELAGLALGRISVARAGIDRWLEHGARLADAGAPLGPTAIEGRYAIAAAGREIIAQAAQLCGSRPLVTRSALDRASRDLQLFLLQHRLDPLLARHGMRLMEDA